ncbi:MAG: hypothetical protein V4503_08560 [Gemmatimonadota bacterium]
MRCSPGTLAVTLLALVGACGHSEPFVAAPVNEGDGPFGVSQPVRLTYNQGMDHLASFSPDGKTLVYAFQDRLALPPAIPYRPDVDRCIGWMAAGGGVRHELCRPDVVGLDSTDAWEQASVGPDGALLYGEYTSAIRSLTISRGALRLGTLENPWPGQVLLGTPNVVGGFSFDHFGAIRWASPTTFFVQVHDQTLIGNPDNETKIDTIALGVGILRGDLSAGGAVFTPVAGTDSASGMALSAGRDSIYFTRLDDAALYVVPASGGARRVVYSEAGASPRVILREASRVGERIAVVRQQWQTREAIKYPDPPYGLKPGSVILLVRPSDGTSSPLANVSGAPRIQGSAAAFGAIVASPDGCRLVVEHRIVQGFTFTTDLYSYCLGPSGQCVCS